MDWRILSAAVAVVVLAGCERATPRAEVAGSVEESPVGAAAAGVAPTGPAAGPPVAPEKPRPVRAAFLPSRDGFAFRNHFEGTPLPAFLEVVAGGIGANLPDHYGLCGGMSLAAADFYLAGRPRPGAGSPPTKGDPLYEYIRDRQNDSFGSGWALVFKTLKWMNLPDEGAGGVRELTAQELDGMLPRVGRGELTALCMILVRRGEGQPWENHQVLAFAAQTRGDTHVLSVYDSNRPRDDHVRLTFTPTSTPTPTPTPSPSKDPPGAGSAGAGKGYVCVWEDGGGRRKAVRGVFATPFAPKSPPAGLEAR